MSARHSLVDIGQAPACCADHGLEALHKAIAEEPSESAIWRPHEDPLLAAPIERWTFVAQGMLQEAQDALLGALGLGDAVRLLRKADAWTAEEMAATRARLAKPMSEYMPDDWIALVDLIFQTRIKPPAVGIMADDLTARAALAGHLHALADSTPETPSLAALAAVMERVARQPHIAPRPPAPGLDYARARVGISLQGVTDAARGRIATTILRHVDEHGLAAPRKLQSSLLDNFGDLNRDWRRIAITESGEVANTAYLGQFHDGARVKRIEAYEGACPFCRRINGMVFTWSTRARPDSDGWTHVWPGKSNVGRSASPKKRGPDGLEDRSEAELWWPAAGVMHPNCRGRWLALPDEAVPAGVDQKFRDWLMREVAKHA